MVHREEGDGLQKQLTDHSLQYCCSMLLKDSKHRVDMLLNPRNPHRGTPQYHNFSQCQQHWLAPEKQRQRQRERGGGRMGGLGFRHQRHRTQRWGFIILTNHASKSLWTKESSTTWLWIIIVPERNDIIMAPL
jgi:hypothetical protein